MVLTWVVLPVASMEPSSETTISKLEFKRSLGDKFHRGLVLSILDNHNKVGNVLFGQELLTGGLQ